MLAILKPISAAAVQLIVFDLDGTLIDSRRDLTTAVNAMLGQMERPEPRIYRYASQAGSTSGQSRQASQFDQARREAAHRSA